MRDVHVGTFKRQNMLLAPLELLFLINYLGIIYFVNHERYMILDLKRNSVVRFFCHLLKKILSHCLNFAFEYSNPVTNIQIFDNRVNVWIFEYLAQP